MKTDIVAGLAGVEVAETEISHVDGEAGRYVYRGHDAAAFAGTASFEDVWYLLHHGSMPADPDGWRARIAAARELPPDVAPLIRAIAMASPRGDLSALRTALSLCAQSLGCRSWLDQTTEETSEQCLRLAALVPLLAAGLYRCARGGDVVVPDASLPTAAYFLTAIHGSEPTLEQADALERYFVLTADHGFCNSTFALRVVASSGGDVGAALCAALGGFAGPLHGGAVGRVSSMLDEVGTLDRVEPYITDVLDRGERLMGFGHPVYRAPDPRARVLRELAESFGGTRIALAEEFERVAIRELAERKPKAARVSNVDFYAGVVLEYAGVPEELFLATFATARAAGWTAHLLEQIASNKIFRPRARYVGAR